MDEESWSVLHPAVAGIGLGLVCLLTVPALRQLRVKTKSSRDGGYEAVPALFESADGQATEDSVAAFSDRGPRIAAWVSLAVGFAASTASAVLISLNRDDFSVPSEPVTLYVLNSWADVPAWVSTYLPTQAPYKPARRLTGTSRPWLVSNAQASPPGLSMIRGLG